jgi:hypothetical protein
LLNDLSSHRLDEGQTIGANNKYQKIIDDGERDVSTKINT